MLGSSSKLLIIEGESVPKAVKCVWDWERARHGGIRSATVFANSVAVYDTTNNSNAALMQFLTAKGFVVEHLPRQEAEQRYEEGVKRACLEHKMKVAAEEGEKK